MCSFFWHLVYKTTHVKPLGQIFNKMCLKESKNLKM